MGPHNQGPRCPCQVDPTYQKPHRPASRPEDVVHNPDDLGSLRRPHPDSGRPAGLVAQAYPLDGDAAPPVGPRIAGSSL
jgi:hypothetical protein